jgi:hypothetical protein
MQQEHPAAVMFRRPVTVQPLRAGLFQYYRPYVWLIVVAIGAVFLVACVNLSTLFLARGRSREQEAAIRTALGASRGQVVRAALAESWTLCLISAGAAVGVCYAAFGALLAVVPPALRGVAVSPLDLRLIVMTTMAALGTALVAGGLPAIRQSRVDVTEGLRHDRRSTGGRLRGGSALLAIEAAFGVFLVAGAAITVQSFLGLVLKNPGFDSADLYEASVQHGWSTDQKTVPPARVQGVVDAIRAAPGVDSAAAVSMMPVGRSVVGNDSFWRARGIDGARFGVGGGLFAALRTPVLAGREFDDDDVARMAMVALVNRAAAATSPYRQAAQRPRRPRARAAFRRSSP